jgi:hypothetical protein
MEDVSHPRLLKRKNVYYLRASYPADLVSRFGSKERWKSLGTSDHREALRKVRAASAAFDAEMERLRLAGDVDSPQQLSQREVAELAGRLYRYGLERWESMPGGPVVWRKLIDAMSKLQTKAALEREMQPYVEEVLSKWISTRVDEDSRQRLMVALQDAIRDAATTLERRANNDYGPDLIAQRFPKPEKKVPAQDGTLQLLIEDWPSGRLLCAKKRHRVPLP